MDLASPGSQFALAKRDFSAGQRAKDANKGKAMPDGSYPIENRGDLENAVRAIGRAKDPAAVKAHIMSRAKALGCEDCIPGDWKPSKAQKAENELGAADIISALEALGERVERAISREPGDEVVGEQLITKASADERYTFGPLYAPNQVDAHDEFTTTEELQKALWKFAERGDYDLRKQHDRSVSIGKVVEQVVWPYEAEVELRKADGSIRKAKMPAGTAYIGVKWAPEAWDDVRAGRIGGYSLGGRAIRVRGLDAQLDPMRKSED